MKRLMCIFNDEKYAQYLNAITESEKHRVFCKHHLQHFLDVARISYILNLEENLGFDKEIIYVTSFLHDIGRAKKEHEHRGHDELSWEIADQLLKNYDFSFEEIQLIKEGIIGHRKEETSNFSNLIYRADKLSRGCYECSAAKECYWPEEKKNKEIKY